MQNIKQTLILALLLLSCLSKGYCQEEIRIINETEYQELKSSGLLNLEKHTLITPNPSITEHVQIQPSVAGGRDGFCDCWIEPDETYTESPFSATGIDDGSTANIEFPFDFDLFGETYNSFWINTNGNLTFDVPNGTFTSTGFPNGAVMLAPFWADVDFGCDDCGTLFYKITDDAVYVNWVEVGYFNEQSDKVNSFQLIFTPDDSAVLENENTVQFCYQDMQWTTGSASQGQNGFGGAPANVGINAGNNIDYISIGLFNENTENFDGPNGLPDGVNALDNQEVNFNPSLNTFANPAPVVFGHNSCDTIFMCQNAIQTSQVTFISIDGENPSEISVNDGGLSTLEFNLNENLGVTTVSLIYDSNMPDGVYEVVLTGSNPNDTNNSTTVFVFVEIDNSIDIPVLTVELGGEVSENSSYCSGSGGVLVETTEGFDNYSWSNGSVVSSGLFTAGEYSLVASIGGCELEVGPFQISMIPAPTPDVSISQDFLCEGETTLVSIPSFDDYESVLWQVDGLEGELISIDNNLSEIEVTAGTYSLTAITEAECDQVSFFTVQSEFLQYPELGVQNVFDNNQFFWSGAYSDPNVCGFNIMMFDSENDTWEGASINVFVDGVGPYTYSISNGFGQVLDGVSAYHGQVIDYYFQPGADDEDIDLTIWNSDNEELFNTQDGDLIFSGNNPFFSQTAECGFNALEGTWDVQVLSGSEDYTFAFPTVFNPVAGANSFAIPEGESGEYLLTFTTANCNTEIEFSLNFLIPTDGHIFDSNNNSSILIELEEGDPTVHSFITDFNNGNPIIYIITDQNNNIITSSGNTFDFSGFDAGNYNVYAVSYNTLPVINTGMNIFLMNLTDGALLSANNVDVTITGFLNPNVGQVFDSNNSSSIVIDLNEGNPTVHSFINTFNNANSVIYIITDQNNNIISSSGNLIDFSGYNSGEYNVYALSYSSFPNINIGVNIQLMNLPNESYLSTNQVVVTILDESSSVDRLDAKAPIFTYGLENITISNLTLGQTITLIDAAGKLIHKESSKNDTWNLALSTFPSGAYFIMVTSKSGNSYSYKMAK